MGSTVGTLGMTVSGGDYYTIFAPVQKLKMVLLSSLSMQMSSVHVMVSEEEISRVY